MSQKIDRYCPQCGRTRSVQKRKVVPKTCAGCKYDRLKGVSSHGNRYLHGHCRRVDGRMVVSRTYKSWESMRDRCGYDVRYLRNGVTVCDRWKDSFVNFLADMGERPEGMTLDRINASGNYEPGNCRWATIETQANNQVRHQGGFKKNNLKLFAKEFERKCEFGVGEVFTGF